MNTSRHVLNLCVNVYPDLLFQRTSMQCWGVNRNRTEDKVSYAERYSEVKPRQGQQRENPRERITLVLQDTVRVVMETNIFIRCITYELCTHSHIFIQYNTKRCLQFRSILSLLYSILPNLCRELGFCSQYVRLPSCKRLLFQLRNQAKFEIW